MTTTRWTSLAALGLALACLAGGMAMMIAVPGGGWLAYHFEPSKSYRIFRDATRFGFVGVPEWALGLIATFAGLGLLASRLAPIAEARARRTSVAASARRFAAWGLGMNAVAALWVLAAFAWRWYLWG